MHITETASTTQSVPTEKFPYDFYSYGTYKGVRWVTREFADKANALAHKKNYDIQYIAR